MHTASKLEPDWGSTSMQRLITSLRRLVCGDRIDRLKEKNDDLEQQVADLEQQVAELEGPDYPEIDYTTVDKDTVVERLEGFDGFEQHDIFFWFDYTYRLPDREDFRAYAVHDGINMREYRDEIYDCDDFSWAFMALVSNRYAINGIGLVITRDPDAHVCNVVLFQDGTVELWEPQDDEFKTDSDDPKYDLDDAVWLI